MNTNISTKQLMMQTGFSALYRFKQPVRLSAPCPLVSFYHQTNKILLESGAPTLLVPPEKKKKPKKHIPLRAVSMPFLEMDFSMCVCIFTLRHASMFSMPALLSDSGSNMSTFRQHETILQAEHTLDWYFQSADFNGLYNFD